MRGLLVGSLVLMLAPGAAEAGTLIVPAQRDATLFEDPDGVLASGAGPSIFAGRSNALVDGVRRGLIQFDVEAELRERPPGPLAVARVAVVLTNVTTSNVAPREYRLHRVLADWGEGTSSSGGGGGATSAPGDATWIHAVFPNTFWMHNGAQFEGEPSARLVVAGPGVYRFEGEGLRRDVALWLRQPDRNFGWILLGDETGRQTVRAFASREHADPVLRPFLEITVGALP